MLTLSEGIFDIAFDDLIEARVSSMNSEGQSLPSEVNTEGARIRVLPAKANTPEKGALTSHN